MTRIILLVTGFGAGATIAAGMVALATLVTHGRVSRDVIRRPVIRTWAAIYVAACGIAGALFALSLASGNL
jgi:multisubunit Na+/H+ antiporter MnhB subunit